MSNADMIIILNQNPWMYGLCALVATIALFFVIFFTKMLPDTSGDGK